MWAHNLEDEFKEICKIVSEYNYVAMDTEFPGVVARPIGEFKSTSDYQYQVLERHRPYLSLIISSFPQLLRCNVDLLKIIQLGLTFFNKEGKTPEGVCTWQVPGNNCFFQACTQLSLFQFNFKFNLSEDMYAEDSVELLQVLNWNIRRNLETVFSEFWHPV